MAIPVTLEEAKAQLRIEADDTAFDTEVQDFLDDAVAWVENYTGHILEEREVTEELGGFAKPRLRAWPINAAAPISVSYADATGPITISAARIGAALRPATLLPPVGAIWPRVSVGTPTTVTFTAGYADDEQPPRNFRRAMLILISAYEADREGGDVFMKAEAAARRLCGPFRWRGV